MIAFRLLEAVLRSEHAETRSWEDALRFVRANAPERASAALLDGARRIGELHPAIFHDLAAVHLSRGARDEALDAIECAVRFGHEMKLIVDDQDLRALHDDPRFSAALRAKVDRGAAHLFIKHGDRALVQPAIGLQVFVDHHAPRAAASLMEALHQDVPEMFAFHRPSGHLRLLPSETGAFTNDIQNLRQLGDAWDDTIHYDDGQGAACERRFTFVGDGDAGEISIALPLSRADAPDALIERVIALVTSVPFSWAATGFTLVPFEEGRVAGPSTDAEGEIARLAASRPGLCLSPAQRGTSYRWDGVSPSWLTFLTSSWTEKVNLSRDSMSTASTSTACSFAMDPHHRPPSPRACCARWRPSCRRAPPVGPPASARVLSSGPRELCY